MATSLTQSSVKRPVTTMVVFAAAVLLGLYSFYQMGVDFLPDVEVQKLTVMTECPGVSALDVEETVTQAVESSLSGLYNVRNMRSVSRDGLSLVHLEFNWGAPMDLAFIKVRNKLDQMRGLLPDFAERPTILRFDPSSAPFMTLAITGERIERPVSDKDYKEALVELRHVAEAVVKPRLEQIEGVAQALVAGGLEREAKVRLDRPKSMAYDVSFADVEAALREYDAHSAGGTIYEGNLAYPLRIEGRYRNIDDIRRVPVKRVDDVVVFLEDIAAVSYGFKEPKGYNRLNGRDTVMLNLYKKTGENTITAARSVDAALAALATEFPDFRVVPVFDQSTFIQEAIDNVLSSLYWGGFFAVMVLFLFIRDLKSPLVVGLAVPVSVIITFAVMHFCGIQFNVVSLSGLALGIGILVDNSIIVLDNVRRLREQGRSLVAAAIEGTKEVSLPIAASTFTTVSVFFPLVYIDGLAGTLYFDQAVTVVASLVISLLVSVSLVSLLLSRGGAADRPADARGGKASFARIGRRLDAFGASVVDLYEGWLTACMRHRALTLAVAAALGVLSASLLSSIDRELMPVIDRKRLVVELEFPNTATPQRTLSAVAEIERALEADPEIAMIYSTVGSAGADLGQPSAAAADRALIEVKIAAGAETSGVMARLESLGRPAGDYELSVRQSPSFLEHFFPQKVGDFVVRLNGETWGALADASEAVQALMGRMPNFAGVRSSLVAGGGGYEVAINHQKAALYGVDVGELSTYLSSQVQGSRPVQLADYSNEVDVKLQVARKEAPGAETLKRLNYPVRNSDQVVYVPVGDLVSVSPYAGYAALHRKDQSRTVSVVAELARGDAAAAAGALAGAVDAAGSFEGVWMELGAADDEIQAMLSDLSLTLLVSFCLVFAILAAKFESLKIPFVVISVVPLALVAVIATLYATGQTLNFMSAMGTVVLIGIVVNDSIVKVDFIRKLHLAGAELSVAVAEAGRRRLRPIAMTTVTTVLGLLPMALSTGQGAELHQPLAWVVIGGLSISTLLTLAVVPVVYSLVCGPVPPART